MVALDDLTANCAPGTAEAVAAAQKAIMDGSLHPFAGPLKNQKGEIIVPAGTTMSDDEIWNMGWFVEGVIGSVPSN